MCVGRCLSVGSLSFLVLPEQQFSTTWGVLRSILHFTDRHMHIANQGPNSAWIHPIGSEREGGSVQASVAVITGDAALPSS